MRRRRIIDNSEEFNVWPAFADLMSNAFMILSFLVLLAIIKPLVSISSLRATEETLKQQLLGLQGNLDAAQASLKAERLRATSAEQAAKQLQQQNQMLASQLQTLSSQNQNLQLQLQTETAKPKTPPIIVIRDIGVYQFKSGSAALPEALNTYIRNQLVPQIEANAKNFQIDVVEIIGHTDGQPTNGGSNLDSNLGNVAKGTTPVSQLAAGSNADLGLMHALAVVQVLQQIQKQEKRLQGLEFRPYSAAQLVSPTPGVAVAERTPDPKRRRIEIRFTRLGQITNVE